MKDSKNVLLLLLSAGLMATWVYHLYDKSLYSTHPLEVLVKDSLATQEAIRDSILKLYDKKTFELDTTKLRTSLRSDSLRGRLDYSIKKILKLRSQIGYILKKSNITRTDLNNANDLIKEYRQSIDEMKTENNDLETERNRLNGVLAELNDEMKGLQQNIQKITQENKELTETINQASTFIASEINLSALSARSGKEAEASAAKKADKFVFSFTLQNNVVKNSFYDVYVVIIDPGKKVLQNDVWGANFVSKTEGPKAYTTKIHFEYNHGERKKILYTMDPDKFLPGNYLLQIYQNGVLIGETNKKLS